MNQFLNQDCLEGLKDFPDNYFDSVVTDAPYGLAFMNKHWDYLLPSVEIWKEVFRTLKAGGHLLCFGGTRTFHRQVVNIEDAGFEIRDMIGWIYGSGFPKSLDISKAIDKMNGAERKVVGVDKRSVEKANKKKHSSISMINGFVNPDNVGMITEPATEDAIKWNGFGTGLKPALEPICLARKPLSEKTIAANVLNHGTGGINIDGCRIKTNEDTSRKLGKTTISDSGWKSNKRSAVAGLGDGRFPANIIHDGSDEVLEVFPDGGSHGGKGNFKQHTWMENTIPQDIKKSSGLASRFFYCAKASKSERNAGLQGLKATKVLIGAERLKTNPTTGKAVVDRPRQNFHPTVKPLKLMEYLVKLVTPPEGIVLDPFAGTGTTALACIANNMDYVCFEIEEDYCRIAEARIKHFRPQMEMELNANQ